MTSLLILITVSFFAGILTVLSPCVLPLLPVILGGGLSSTDKKRPYIIIVSLMISLMLFTLLLKASTLLIDIEPKVWEYISGGILIIFGSTLTFPKIWSWFVTKTGIEHWSQNSLQHANEKSGIWGPIAIGSALGPVFSSCNPTYSLLLATVLPLNITSGLIGMTAYFVGLGSILLLITLGGRSILVRGKFFVNPEGVFRKILGILIIIVGVSISFGMIKNLQTWVVKNGNFSFLGSIEERLNNYMDAQPLKKDTTMCTQKNCEPKNKNAAEIPMDIWYAPEITGITDWINSEPLTIESLRGQVILLDFWTYSCINCQQTQPYLNAWYDKYAKDGLTIIGLHAPEFSFEKLKKNVENAVKEAGIKYPVALDNNFTTWNAYANKYWPAKYLIDENGNIVYKHFGEGDYTETEKKIQELLGIHEKLEKEVTQKGEVKTPETYLGSARAENRVDSITKKNQWALRGSWQTEPEYIESGQDDSSLQLRFSARKVFLVVSLAPGVHNGTLLIHPPKNIVYKNTYSKEINVTQDTLYTIFESKEFESDRMVEIQTTPGIRLHAFTFGN